MKREFDLVLWGATGFTGKLVAEYLLEAYGANGQKLKWAIAGRSISKLNDLKTQLVNLNPEATNISVLTSDSSDLESLRTLARSTKVICSTVGPYNLFGKTLLEACIEESTDYTDLTGEPNFIRYSIDSFHEKAKEKKIRIVHSCGFDSIPSDLGTLLLQTKSQEKFKSFCKEILFVAGDSKGSFSGGTISSLIGVVEDAISNPKTREMLLDPYSLNPPGIKGEDKTDSVDIVYIDALKTWSAPFLMGPINTRVVRRSSALIYESNPFLYQEKMGFGDGFGGWTIAQVFRTALSGMLLMSSNSVTRSFLNLFMPGSGEGPDKDTRDTGYFTITILGFKEQYGSIADIKVEIFGQRDPGYGATSRMLAESSVALALGETRPIYGILTPASAFGLPLLKRMEKVGIQFRDVTI